MILFNKLSQWIDESKKFLNETTIKIDKAQKTLNVFNVF